jgi:hypothetical protein
MKLKDYIEDYGVKKIAAICDVELNAVYQWVGMTGVPRPKHAAMIVSYSNGLVDWNDIYQPYFDQFNKDPNQLTFEDLK